MIRTKAVIEFVLSTVSLIRKNLLERRICILRFYMGYVNDSKTLSTERTYFLTGDQLIDNLHSIVTRL